MGSSSSGGNPMFLSQGGQPIPGLPVAGQGAPNDNPQTFGKFQEFLPTIQAPGGTAGGYTIPSNAETRAAPSATGLKSEMFQYRSPFSSAGAATVSNSGANTGAASGAGAATPAAGGGGVSQADVDSLKQQLAQLQASAANYQPRQRSVAASGSPTDGPYPSDLWGY